jgi:hypothetical protein
MNHRALNHNRSFRQNRRLRRELVARASGRCRAAAIKSAKLRGQRIAEAFDRARACAWPQIDPLGPAKFIATGGL